MITKKVLTAGYIEAKDVGKSLEVDDGEITFNYGLHPDGVKQETASVLGIVSSPQLLRRGFELAIPLTA